MEEQLIRRAGRGDMDAFAQLAGTHAPSVYRFCYTGTGDPDAAFDLTLKTFQTAWHAIGLYQFDTTFEAWIQAIAEDKLPKNAKAAPTKQTPEEIPVPERLTEAVMGRIQSEQRQFLPKQVLGRMKFTLLALVIVLLMWLAFRLGWIGQKQPAAPVATSTPAPTSSFVPAELHPVATE